MIIWGLGIGDWVLGPISNPQLPIPFYSLTLLIIFYINYFILKLIL